MRLASLLVLLALAGCASSAPSTDTAGCDPHRPAGVPCRRPVMELPAAEIAARAQRQARADSILALPPDSLTQTDLAWLQLYQQTRQTELISDQQRQQQAAIGEARRAVNAYAIISVVAAVGSLVYYIIATKDL